MLILGIEFCPDELNLVNCLWRVAEFAWGAKAVGAWRGSQPKLVYSRVSQVESHFITRTVLAQVKWHCPTNGDTAGSDINSLNSFGSSIGLIDGNQYLKAD